MPSTASRIAAPAIATASHTTTPVFPGMMPSSTMCLISSGITTTSAASTTVKPRKPAIRRRCGLANPNTRPTVRRSTRLWTTLRSVRM